MKVDTLIEGYQTSTIRGGLNARMVALSQVILELFPFPIIAEAYF